MSSPDKDSMRGFDPQTLKAWDKAHVWHPFTPMSPYMEGDPPLIARAEGFRLQDVDGNWFLDGSSSIWVNVHGHGVEALDSAIRSQLDQVAQSWPVAWSRSRPRAWTGCSSPTVAQPPLRSP